MNFDEVRDFLYNFDLIFLPIFFSLCLICLEVKFGHNPFAKIARFGNNPNLLTTICYQSVKLQVEVSLYVIIKLQNPEHKLPHCCYRCCPNIATSINLEINSN